MPIPSPQELDAYRNVTDPKAEAVIERLVTEEGPEEARRLFEILIRNVDIPFADVPDYVGDYMRDNGTIPAGIDMERVKRGQQVFHDYGGVFVLALYCKSLPTCYVHSNAVPVLAITGRLDESRGYPEVFARRVLETAQFLLDVMAIGSLEVGESGMNSALKVRLIHAAIRFFIQKSPKWDKDQYQLPINQEDLAYTLMTFSYSLIEALHQLKIPISEQDAEDYFYAWNLVGHLMGVEPSLIPSSVKEGKALLAAIGKRHTGPTEEGVDLTKALIVFIKDLSGNALFENSTEIFIRFFMGEEGAKILGLSDNKGCLAFLLPRVLGRLMGWGERLEDKSESMELLGNKMGMAIIKGAMNQMNRFKGQTFQVPESMQDRWGLS